MAQPQTRRDLQDALQDEGVATIYHSWQRRRETMDHIRPSDFDEWLFDNHPFFDELDVQVNLDLVLEFFNQKKAPFRRCKDAKRASLSIEERIIKGNEFFDPGDFAKYLPHEGDQIGLFLRLLHHNLPMHSVDPVWKPKV